MKHLNESTMIGYIFLIKYLYTIVFHFQTETDAKLTLDLKYSRKYAITEHLRNLTDRNAK